MRKPGWDARRRNRNIGTAKSGRGQNNRLTIPESWASERLFYEKLNNPVSLTCKIDGNSLTFLIERTHSVFCHACTPQDIKRVLKLIPPEHLAPIKMLVLRQPKKKEQILSPVWGRLHYWSEIEKCSGPAIYLDAQPINKTYRWNKSLTPDDTRELERLERDGHQVRTDRRYHYVTGNLEAVRCTQLYRTLPHEIGHYVDYLKNVTVPAGEDLDKWERLSALYASKPTKDKEDFAHRYATEFMERQVRLGNLPFDRLFDIKQLTESQLNPQWFSDLPSSSPSSNDC